MRSYHDLDLLAGAWVENPAFDGTREAQDRVDEAMSSLSIALDIARYVDYCRNRPGREAGPAPSLSPAPPPIRP